MGGRKPKNLNSIGYGHLNLKDENIGFNSEHRKMPAKQHHVCKEMNQYTINTNRKWILSFGIEMDNRSEVHEITF